MANDENSGGNSAFKSLIGMGFFIILILGVYFAHKYWTTDRQEFEETFGKELGPLAVSVTAIILLACATIVIVVAILQFSPT